MPGYVSTSSEFVVNTLTISHQDQPRIAHFSNGNYVVIWKSISGDTSDSATLMAQIFDPLGNRIGGEFTVETHGGGMQLNPSVAVLADDSFVVTWQSEDSGFYGSTSTIAAQRFSSSGMAIGSEFAVNSSSSSFPTAPTITALSNGGYVVLWDNFLTQNVRAQVFTANGVAVGSELIVGSYSGGSGTSLDVAALPNGGFVATWNAPDGSSQGVRAQIFSSTGAEVTSEFWVNTQTTDNQSGPEVIALANGNFLVLWTSYNAAQDGSFSAVMGQLYSANGTALGGEFLINQESIGYQGTARATPTADGGFIVAWHSTGGGANSYDNTLRARVFDSNGTASGNEFQVDALNSSQPSQLGGLTTLPDGSVRIVYSTWGGDGDGDGVLLHTLVPAGPNSTAPTIVSNGGTASAIVTVNEYTNLAASVQAFDPDGPQTTTFAITGGADAARFTINTITGRLTFVSTPEFANPTDANGDNVYDVVVTASDGTLSDTQALQVVVQDVDETITFGGPSQFQLNENEQVAGSAAASSAATLPIYYQIIGGDDAALLSIDPFTGTLYFNTAPDFENPGDANGDNTYEVLVMAGNAVASATAAFVVQVQNVADGDDIVSPDAVTIDESSAFVVTVQAVSNTEYFLYTITGGDDAGLFGIDQQTGDLYFLNAPDYEQPFDVGGDNVYQVEVTAWAQPSGSPATQLISVTVANVLEGPVLISGMFANTLENQTSAMQIQAFNPEGNPLVYSFVSQPNFLFDDALFVIDANTGEISFLTAPDAEMPADLGGDNWYDLLVNIADPVSGLSTTGYIQIHVDNVNEAPAIAPFAPVSVLENTFDVGTLTAEDVDGDLLTWSIAGGADAAYFGINPYTGGLYFTSMPNYEAPADSDGNNVYEVLVQASDGSLSAVQTVTVTVGNANEAPLISVPGTFFAVNENTTAVTTVSGVDPDGTAPIFSIAGGADAARFTIDASTGVLSFVSAPNYEAPTNAGLNNLYEVYVSAGDGVLSSVVGLQVLVGNVNEAPVITSSNAFAINENTAAVATLAAADPEGTPHTWSITGGADAARFTINAQTGALSFVSVRNFESPNDVGHDNVYQVTVTASAGTLSSSQTISVTVGDVNEAPMISSNGAGGSAVISVAENSVAVTTVTSIDPENAQRTYSISGGADAALFTIDAATGVLSFVNAPNFEAPGDAGGNNAYDVIVQVSDGTLSDTQALTVTVGNANEGQNVPAGQGFTASENSIGAGIFTATDIDGDALSYAISGGADAALFTIDSVTGAVSFLSAPDFETPGDAGQDNVFDLVITASDGSISTNGSFVVTVGNTNEAPVITGSASLAASEGSTAVATLSSSDPENDARSWAISGGADAALFVIDTLTGALSFLNAPDFEVPGDVGGDNQYLVQVSVSDGSLTASQLFTINLGNVNEAPLITSNGGGASAALSVSENSASVTTVTSSDPEGTARTYSIVGGADAARFTINAATGALSFIAPPNYEAPSDAGANNVYDVIVAASDGFLTDTQALAITVGNVNEAPLITSNGGGDTASVTVNENTTTVATIASTDPEGTARTYTIVGGADAARFAINPTTGALSFISAANWEAPTDVGADNVYNVIVAASDGTLTDTQALAVTVGNVVDGSTINGTNAANTLTGTVAEDTINGLGGNDTITGGLGADVLTGGSGADRFVYSALNHSSLSAPDRITDFSLSQNDRISLSAIDANTSLSGDQAFSWIGTGNFTNVAGQLRYYQQNGHTYVTGDVNGDGVGDFLIQLDPAVTLSATYFLL